MPQLFQSLKDGVSYLRVIEKPLVRIEEWTFRLHFKVTTTILIFFTVLLSATDYIGKTISCLPIKQENTGDTMITAHFMDTFCLMDTTFTVPYKKDGTHVSSFERLVGGVPGGWPYVQGETAKKVRSYYQWVPFYFTFLALLFYLPHLYWKSVENLLVRKLLQDLNTKKLDVLAKKQTKQVKLLARYLWDSRGTHVWWCCAYLISEVWNFATVIFCMFLTDTFLQGEFSEYGIKVLEFLNEDPETRVDPMSLIFPRVTKCVFRYFGSSGNVQSFDTVCVLSANILNEKIFVFLWMWFILLCVVNSVNMLYRIGIILNFRLRLCGLNVPVFAKNSQLISVLRKLDMGDWMLCRLLRLNLDERMFMKVITGVYDELVDMRLGQRQLIDAPTLNTIL